MKKNCSECGVIFEITEDDLAFYKKMSLKVGNETIEIPTPKLCPDCRQRRRLAFRNERFLYQNKSDLSGDNLISYISPDKPYKIYSQKEWWSDKWDGVDFGMDFDFNKTFSEQFNELLLKVPRMNLLIWQSDNCDYCNFVDFCKDCYLVFGASNSEKVYYSNLVDSCFDSIDLSSCKECELCYESIDCIKCYNTLASNKCKNSINLSFCFDCKNCEECIGCCNLQHKKYYIFNEQNTKEEYFEKKKKMNINKRSNYESLKKQSEEIINKKVFYQDNVLISCENCSGDNLTNSKNAHLSFESNNLEDCKWANFSMNSKDAYDIIGSSKKGVELTCEGMCIEGKNIFSGFYIAGYSDVYYSDFVAFCTNVFGCTGIKHKKYCVLNKQYSKEEYEKIVPKIINHMIKTGEWGEFFPIILSPFAYNETVAQEYFPLTKEEVLEKSWRWKDQKDQIPNVTKIIPAEKLPDDIKDIPDDVLKWAIKCEKTNRPFRIQKVELEFYRKVNLPIPHFHPDIRHENRREKKNPRILFDRKCDTCQVEIKTTYAPEKPGKVYCEKCYLKEIN